MIQCIYILKKKSWKKLYCRNGSSNNVILNVVSLKNTQNRSETISRNFSNNSPKCCAGNEFHLSCVEHLWFVTSGAMAQKFSERFNLSCLLA